MTSNAVPTYGKSYGPSNQWTGFYMIRTSVMKKLNAAIRIVLKFLCFTDVDVSNMFSFLAMTLLRPK